MQQFIDALLTLWNESGLARLMNFENGGWKNLIMIAVACVLLFLAIKKQFEPLLLLPIAFGMLLVNLPLGGVMDPQRNSLEAFSAEEMWQAIPHTDADEKASVYLNDMPAFDEALTFPEITEKWNRLFEMRDDVMKALELARAEKLVGKSLEAKITLYTKDTDMLALLRGFGKELNTVFIVSGVALSAEDAPADALTDGASGVGVLVAPADGCKCDRCWSYSENGVQTEDGGFLCECCKNILGL